VKQQPSAGSLITEPWIDTICPFDVVDAPVGGSQAARSYVDLLSYASYAQMDNSYSSYTALLSGP
jgi:hypothetical protein